VSLLWSSSEQREQCNGGPPFERSNRLISCERSFALCQGITFKPKNIYDMLTVIKFVLEVISKKSQKELIARNKLKEWKLSIDFDSFT